MMTYSYSTAIKKREPKELVESKKFTSSDKTLQQAATSGVDPEAWSRSRSSDGTVLPSRL